MVLYEILLLNNFFLVFGYNLGRTYIDKLTAIESPPNNSVTTSGERGIIYLVTFYLLFNLISSTKNLKSAVCLFYIQTNLEYIEFCN